MPMDSAAPVFFLVGTSHQTAPLHLREKLSLDEAKTARLADRLRATPGLREFVVLNTCNRVELYGVAANAPTVQALRHTVAEVTGCDATEFEAVSAMQHNHAAITHLFAVAAGLDSQIVGEAEILGQVKGAYAHAQERQWTGPVLNRIFQKTFQAAKYIRTHTAVGQGQISIATVAVDLAGRIFGELSSTQVLVIGPGDIGQKTAQAFQSRGAQSITVAGRTLANAEQTAARAGGEAASLAHLPALLAKADIVACSTSAPDAVITAAMVDAAMSSRRARPLFLIDLALPRDVDPAAADLANVFLYNLDDLAKIAEENLAQRRSEVAKCKAIVDERSAALWSQVAPYLAPGTNGTAPRV